MPKFEDSLWLGTQQSYDAFCTKLELAEQAQAKGMLASEGDFSVTTLSGDTAVISISGPLVSGSAGFWKMFGILGYDDIADEMVNALANPDVKSIVLSVDSGGGAVSGVQDLADMIAEIDKIKPVVTHTSGMMASAAYWLGSSARKLYVTPTSESGSIGVISIHAERSKQLAEDGVKVTIIRSGKYKALANPYEPLSDVAKEQIQAKSDKLYDMFLGYVAGRRNMSVATADRSIGQGRTFLGEDAVNLGLADSLGNLGTAIGYAQSLTNKPRANMRSSLTASLDNSISHQNNNQTGKTQMPKAFTADQLAALASGAAVEPNATELEVEDTTPAAEATTTNTQAEETTATETSTETTATTSHAADVLAFVKSQLVEANDALLAAKVEIASLKATVDGMKANHDGLLTIARNSVGNMLIALNSSAAAAEGLDATAVLAEHARLSTAFKAKFKIGGVAATKPEDDKPAVKASFDPIFAFAASTVSQGAK